MHPLIVISGLGTGGAERSTAEFLPYLRNHGIAPTVACLHRSSEGVQDAIVSQGFDVRFLTGRSLVAKTSALRKQIAELKPDLVHTTIFEADIAGRLAAIDGPPVLTSLVNVAYHPVRRQDPNIKIWRLSVARIIEALSARVLTSHFHAISTAVKTSAISQLGISAARITVIERGRDPTRLGTPSRQRRNQARRALGIAQDVRVLTTVGRQEFQKGQKYLLIALQKIVRRHPNTILLLAGRQGHATEELKATLKRSSVSHHVRVLGHRDDIPNLLACADVFVFPSLYEGLGGSIIEAMALGLPVVASDLPAIRELVRPEENGLLVAPQSPDELADAVATLLDMPEWASTLGRRGRRRFLDRFTAERSHQRLMDLYYHVRSSGRRGRFHA